MIHADTQRNKYHIQPSPMAQNAFFRFSCTCNAPTTLGFNASLMLFRKIRNSTGTNETIAAIFPQQRERIADFFQLPEGTEVILSPSGSDAEYLPVALARTSALESSKLAQEAAEEAIAQGAFRLCMVYLVARPV